MHIPINPNQRLINLIQRKGGLTILLVNNLSRCFDHQGAYMEIVLDGLEYAIKGNSEGQLVGGTLQAVADR